MLLFSSTPTMITDLRDLEPLLSQYDPGLILVGPVLSLSMGGQRYFYIAANGSKVFEAISLGYSEDEADAENQRENIAAILKSRFREMLPFDSHTEMVRAANARWPNEETARVLALATLSAEPQPHAAAPKDTIEDESKAQGIAGDDSQQPVADVARKPADQDVEAVPKGGLPWAVEETWPAQSQEPPSRPAAAPTPSGRADGSPYMLQQKHSGRNDDDITAITRALRAPDQLQSAPKQPASTPRSSQSGERVGGAQRGSERSRDLLAIMASFTRPDLDQADVAAISRAMKSDPTQSHSSWFSIGSARNLAALILLMLAVGGASAWFTRAMLRSDRWGVPHEVATTTSPKPAAATASLATPAQQTASGEPMRVEAEQGAATSEPTQRDGPAFAARTPSPLTKGDGQRAPSEPTGQIGAAPVAAMPITPAAVPSGGASQAKAVPASRPTNGPAQVGTAPSAIMPSPSTPSGGSSAQAETIPASPPEKRTTATEAKRLVELAPAAVPPSLSAPQPTAGASVQANPVPAARPEQQATNEPAKRVEPAPVAVVPPSPPPLPSGSATIQPKPGPAARPEQQAMATEPAHQIETPAAAMTPSRMAPQPTGGASPQAKAAPDASSERQAIASVSGTQPTPAQGSGTASRAESQENIRLIERGSDFLKRGDLASARLLLRRAAEAGSEDAALKLGSTFDPSFIQQLGVIGIEPDVARARQWYEKAAELGSDVALQRLAELKKQ